MRPTGDLFDRVESARIYKCRVGSRADLEEKIMAVELEGLVRQYDDLGRRATELRRHL